MTPEAAQLLYGRWMAMWNGDLAEAHEIVAPDCVVHQAPFGTGESPEFRGPEGVARMVEMGRAPFEGLRFEVEVGPLVDADFIAARWVGRGIYDGGLALATAPAGTAVEFRGNDIIRVEGGLIAEYWVSSDGAHLMAQLGMI